MNYYQDELVNELGRLARLERQAQHEASLNTLDTLRRLFRDLERNNEFDYDKAVIVIERLEDIHIKAMEANYE